jgi:glutamine amidotransferase
MKVAIIDYEMGNLFSVRHACEAVGLEPVVTTDKNVLLGADAAILPGVGAFGAAMDNLRKLDLVSPILEFIASGKPFMGICLGMQLVFEESEEFGTHKGLGLVRGRVKRFSNGAEAGKAIKVPQIGWNRIAPPKDRPQAWKGTALGDVTPGEYMYFVHSYYTVPSDPQDALTITEYEGTEYCSAIKRGNLFASQFHPEKSAVEGLKIYRSWASSITKRS